MAEEEETSEEGSNDLVVAAVPEGQGKLVCIQYPGFVESVDRAISSLGGIKTIEKVYNEKYSVLEARLRQEDRYSKPLVGRPLPVTNMVLRVKRRRRGRGEGGEEMMADKRSSSRCQVEVLGMVKQNYEFKAMADFQILPPGLNQVPHRGETLDPAIFQLKEPFDDAFEMKSFPLFLPPWTFSKFDKPSNYVSRPDFQHKVTGNQMAGNSRQRRPVYAIGIPFDQKGPVPSKPHPDLPEVPPSGQHKLEAVRELFEERPIWSRGWIQYKTKLPAVLVRSILATVSYYFTTGPWKMLWVRLGYDPRCHPVSKSYQCLDYRIPREVVSVSTLESKRKRLKRGAVYQQGEKQSFQLTDDHQSQPTETLTDSSTTEMDTCPVFLADQLPTQRQLYYQLCDLQDDHLQSLIHTNDGQEGKCTEINGWCEEGVYDTLRKTLGEMVRKTAERVDEDMKSKTDEKLSQ